MTIWGLILAIVLFAILYWILQVIPVNPALKRILLIVLLVIAFVIVLFWLLSIVGLGPLNQRIIR